VAKRTQHSDQQAETALCLIAKACGRESEALTALLRLRCSEELRSWIKLVALIALTCAGVASLPDSAVKIVHVLAR
jgi:hypothetical protein